jgi:nitroimidazol reductase NimA-like FMN-containing flavoprotein (pyridoxamine 5'-phosphate oxidase superfamily)
MGSKNNAPAFSSTMRRTDRERPREFALAVIDKAPYGTAAMTGPDGAPYCVPLSPARDGSVIYFHCAKEGAKLDILRANAAVCVSFVSAVAPYPGKFSISYESAIVKGRVQEVTERQEKVRALRLICEKYTPLHMAAFDKAIEDGLDATSVWKITLDEVTGKERPAPQPDVA